jgi:hypothetical protein
VQFSGRSTVCPLLFTYVPLLVQFTFPVLVLPLLVGGGFVVG